jgi:peroxiredoxin
MKLRVGDVVPAVSATTIHGKPVTIPDREVRWVHLQFRRFAGCPVCNFHLRSLSLRNPEIQAKGIHEIVFFHSAREEMLRYQAELPFDCVADPTKSFYRRFGVETSLLAPFHPAVLWAGMRNFLATRRLYTRAENGILGLPADFLIEPDGRVAACRYGTHAYDNWGADELLRLT